MARMPFKVTHDMLTLDDVVAAVAERTGEETPAGAVTSFIGQVRGDNLGKRVIRLEYEGYEPLALKTFERIRKLRLT